MRGEYHYHGPSACLPDESGNEVLIGYALDGFGIYSVYDANGRELTNADLDDCHGRVSEVEWGRRTRAEVPLRADARIPLHHRLLPRLARIPAAPWAATGPGLRPAAVLRKPGTPCCHGAIQAVPKETDGRGPPPHCLT
jgi:hypothetical protein